MGFISMLVDAALLASTVAQSGSLNNGCLVFQCNASVIEICELYRRDVLVSSLSLAERVKLLLTRLGQGIQTPLQKRRLRLHFGSPTFVAMLCMILLIADQRPFR
ncbi:hypothetical protein B0T13DRAFT_269977 [Neurospora crassa]|nr:hypothetical protein B0T13DRAFT_269977 [Neurospora crassa]